jgi:hypothetical protein
MTAPLTTAVVISDDGEQAHVTLLANDGKDTVTFTYDLDPRARLDGVEVRRNPTDMGGPRNWAFQLNSTPFARLEDLAAQALTSYLDGTSDLEPEALVSRLFPELDGALRGNALRRRRSLVFLASVAREYVQLQVTGNRNPAQAMAEKHSVASGTVRGWLTRARREGVAPASSHGNSIINQEGRPS